MSSLSCLIIHSGYPLSLNFCNSLSRIVMNFVGEDVHLKVLRISPFKMVLNVSRGWQELKCRKAFNNTT